MFVSYLEQSNGHTIMECLKFFEDHGVIEEAVFGDNYVKIHRPLWNFEKCKYRPIQEVSDSAKRGDIS